MWPALMLAASRKDRVIGRTVTLVVSIIIKNGFNQSGAPSGRRWAIDAFKFLVNDENMNDIHIGNPRHRVIIR